MPQPSPAASSTKSNLARKGSANAASESAKQAFAASSDLALRGRNDVPADQAGRKRLVNSYLIPRENIVPDPDQPRRKFDEQSIRELMASVKERGIKQPLTVRWSTSEQKYMVIDGGRRFEAATRLKLDELPCWVQQGDRKEVLIDQIVHNWQRVDLRPFETADALARLRDEHGLKQVDLCRVTGKPKSEISKLLALHDKVDPEVQQIAREDTNQQLTRRHLYNISKIKPEKQREVAQQVQQENLTAQQTEKLIAAHSPKLKINKQAGLAARQRRFRTGLGEVVITFRRQNPAENDVRAILSDVLHRLAG